MLSVVCVTVPVDHSELEKEMIFDAITNSTAWLALNLLLSIIHTKVEMSLLAS